MDILGKKIRKTKLYKNFDLIYFDLVFFLQKVCRQA